MSSLTVGIVTLGCDKNTVDNEYLAGLLDDAGCKLLFAESSDFAEPVDVAVVTTCGFVGDAQRQSVETIVELAEQKRTAGKPERLYVAGCLSQKYSGELAIEIPEIDGIVGVGQFAQLARMIVKGLRRTNVRVTPSASITQYMRRKRWENKPHAYLKIADGCNHGCSFCGIPQMKGRLKSVPRDVLLREAEELVGQGIRELDLIAQDITVYGQDKKDGYLLPELLADLERLKGDFWIRLLYAYPGGVDDALIARLAQSRKIVPYLDIPVQHFDAEILRRMNRPAAAADVFGLVGKLRAAVPGIVLRTSLIVGFPGETPAAHKRMLEAMQTLRFDRLGAFQYSAEENTPAARAPRQVTARTRAKRRQAVMDLQAEISAELVAARIGQTARVLVEDYDPVRRMVLARSAGEAPEVDGSIVISAKSPPPVGAFVDVKFVNADTYDLYAELVPNA